MDQLDGTKLGILRIVGSRVDDDLAGTINTRVERTLPEDLFQAGVTRQSL